MRLASPDGTRFLLETNAKTAPQLWIDEPRIHRRAKLFDLGGTWNAGWSPDGSAFYVNDHWASDRERSYIYNAATLQRIDVGKRILAQDPDIRRFAAGHAYFQATGWNDSQTIAATFSGHTDEPPVTEFKFRFRVSRTGAVQRLKG
jgi:hypothetical protein